MKSALKLTGLPDLRRQLQAARRRAQTALHAATQESLIFLEGKAQEILDAEIYHKAREPYEPELTLDLYRAFVHSLQTVGVRGLKGELVNTSPHAVFLEFGTDDEGTGEHFVPAATGGVLHFINPFTGANAFSKGHFVHGIHPIRFMERALREHEADVIAIFQRHLAAVFG